VTEAIERLDHVRRRGATPFAFTFRNRFSADQAAEIANPLDTCSV
jgi:hypothetical protein